jgi:large subunit ribosomal protein L4
MGNGCVGNSLDRVADGPDVALLLPAQPKDWSIKMNKKERRLALATALQSAAADITVVDDLTVEDKKTKTLLATLNKVSCLAVFKLQKLSSEVVQH